MPRRPELSATQAALYAAETRAIDRAGLRWRRLAHAQAYLDDLVSSAWFFDRWPTLLRCTVERRGARSVWSTCHHLDHDGPGATTTEGVILVADGSLAQPVVLHELAHLVVAPGIGHGPAFAETLLTLVRHEMGFFAFAEYYEALRRTDAFRLVRTGIDVPAGAGGR
jgi:putative metallohydrolase (TIGR04338 family)